ncbi:hypothetical protein ACFPPD_05390 [Cohnella suwonensis]|uniref:Uncharacterized protein n=1 Tax=Cohnella suwonensis TaxID=696072 RepID=A0ABW0LS84_9BACL
MVSFKDIDQDGKKDVIVLADYLTGPGSEGNVPFTVPTVFIQKDKEFISDLDLDSSLYSSGDITMVSDVVAYFKKKTTQEEVNIRLCRKVLAPNMEEGMIEETYGGGTMWGHNGNREIGFLKYYMNKYVKMKQKGAAASSPKDVKEAEKEFDDELQGLNTEIQKFKKLTSEKDDAGLLLLNHLVDRVGSSVNE